MAFDRISTGSEGPFPLSLVIPFERVFRETRLLLSATVATVGLLFLARLSGPPGGAQSPGTRRAVSAAKLVAAGLVLIAAGLYPFIVTGKAPAADGPESRFAILVAPSLGVAAAGLGSFFFRPDHPRIRRIIAWVGIFLLTAFALQDARIYADWQACAIKDKIVEIALRRLEPPPGVDDFVIRGTHLEHTYHRRFYDWGLLLHEAWGGYDRIAVPLDEWRLVRRQDYTPLGLNREMVANFRRWMGYGQPGPPDRWCLIDIGVRPGIDAGPGGVYALVGEDILHRLGLCAQTRAEWLLGYVSNTAISAVHDFPFSSSLLQPVRFDWRNAQEIRVAATLALPVRSSAFSGIGADPDLSGAFSIEPSGDATFAIRCEALPAHGGAAMLSLRMLVRSTGSVRKPPSPGFGVACDFKVSPGAPRPQLVLVTIPYLENPGYESIPGLDSIETWSTATPSHALLIWSPDAAGEVLEVRSLKAGYTKSFEDAGFPGLQSQGR